MATLSNYISVWQRYGAIPEAFVVIDGMPKKDYTAYHLRPGGWGATAEWGHGVLGSPLGWRQQVLVHVCCSAGHWCIGNQFSLLGSSVCLSGTMKIHSHIQKWMRGRDFGVNHT